MGFWGVQEFRSNQFSSTFAGYVSPFPPFFDHPLPFSIFLWRAHCRTRFTFFLGAGWGILSFQLLLSWLAQGNCSFLDYLDPETHQTVDGISHQDFEATHFCMGFCMDFTSGNPISDLEFGGSRWIWPPVRQAWARAPRSSRPTVGTWWPEAVFGRGGRGDCAEFMGRELVT